MARREKAENRPAKAIDGAKARRKPARPAEHDVDPAGLLATTAAEKQLLIEAAAGNLIDVSSLPIRDRVVRPAFFRNLILGNLPDCLLPHSGLRSVGLVFEEPVNLSYLTATDGRPLPPLRLFEAHFKDRFIATATSLTGLWLTNARLDAGLMLNQAQIVHHLWMDGVACTGEIDIKGANIGGQLALDGATLNSGKGLAALSADKADIGGGVFCNLLGSRRFTAAGSITFVSARMTQLGFVGARLVGPAGITDIDEGSALRLDGAVIQGGAYFKSLEGTAFESVGTLCLSGATINGGVAFRDAKLSGHPDEQGTPHPALVADGVTITEGLVMDRGFTAVGGVRLRSSRLSDVFAWGQFSSAASALDLSDANIRRLSMSLHSDSRGVIQLEGAAADTLDSLDPNDWGNPPVANEGVRIDLDGFIYRRAEISRASRTRTRTWAKFLRKDPIAENVLDLLDRGYPGCTAEKDHFLPQPFEQAARALREVGHGPSANEIAVAKREFQRHCGADGPTAGFLALLSLIFFRYGYGPLRASAWTLALVLIGAAGVWWGQATDLLVTIAEPGHAAARCAEVPLALALDTFLPLVDFGVETRCRVAPGLAFSGVAEAFRVTYAIVGWLFIPMVALTFSGLLRKD